MLTGEVRYWVSWMKGRVLLRSIEGWKRSVVKAAHYF